VCQGKCYYPPLTLQYNLFHRLRLHEEKIIKDRRHHLKTYPNCFVAKELIDWLIDHKEASDRETAIKLVQKLLDRSIIHHGKMMGHSHLTMK
uniref:DEP domain-containing protein n=1 Tax=Laticauda laticaudata TaxID=8630 RepID=A0A8C5WU23_LATLA